MKFIKDWSRDKKFNAVFILILLYIFLIQMTDLYFKLPFLSVFEKLGYHAILFLTVIELSFKYRDKKNKKQFKMEWSSKKNLMRCIF